jgi:isocitrate dehydrogenase
MNSNEGDRHLDAKVAADESSQATGGMPEEKEQGRHAALYDRFSERVRELFEAGQEKSKEALDKAMDVAREQFSAAGEFSAQQGEVFKQYMRRDLEQTEQEMRVLGKDAKERLHPARLGAGALSSMARLLDAAGSALQSLSRKAEEALHYSTGEITAAGTLTCTKCGQKVQLKHTAKIPPCPGCHGTEFRKGY